MPPTLPRKCDLSPNQTMKKSTTEYIPFNVVCVEPPRLSDTSTIDKFSQYERKQNRHVADSVSNAPTPSPTVAHSKKDKNHGTGVQIKCPIGTGCAGHKSIRICEKKCLRETITPVKYAVNVEVYSMPTTSYQNRKHQNLYSLYQIGGHFVPHATGRQIPLAGKRDITN